MRRGDDYYENIMIITMILIQPREMFVVICKILIV
jgi:hypothetical protein